jgi:hypothetical protein
MMIANQDEDEDDDGCDCYDLIAKDVYNDLQCLIAI